MKFAYADPPYIGQAKRHYSHDPLCAEVDHPELIAKLMREFPDGWALSASSTSLDRIIPLLPKGFRIAVWCKSFCAFKRNVRPCYAWEPVIFFGGRNPINGHRAAIPERNGKQLTPKDFIVEPITLKKGLVGAKPEKVCRWILDLLNVQPGDEVVDLFPGTGIMGKVAEEITSYKPQIALQDNRCINWPCALPQNHNSPCSSSAELDGPDYKIQGKEW